MKFSVVIPAHNEDECIASTVTTLCEKLNSEKFDYEIIVVADHCTDNTEEVVAKIANNNKRIILVKNEDKPGFGMAVRRGLDAFTGDAVAIFMADASDSPDDLVKYFKKIEHGADCVFGSRFIKGGKVVDYPIHKLILNRLGNLIIRLLFRHGLNDTTNAFKCYRREVIETCRPFLSPHFNLTVELPLKAYIRGYKFEIIPISWHNRKTGVSKLKIKEMGSRYFFIILYCLLEKLMVSRDYHKDYK
ncbi:MAG TPA: glycosyltransferase family 2 protein [Victivallales bacterium]|nr:glycosyltransferase family 2 protein [Victivallales bacterium]HPO91088.1 glycosyltransferase family 2 protein [Victivallales bacterium]HRR05886.1 glycosyltransferase family 2 protein [Victivallales bacterium]HRU00082.1 glycosyltransferase family 2 protein [Victivallales bacterium]